jgi:ParB family chromosome partitioning protein
MAEAAEQLVAGTGWLPAPMRTPGVVQGSAERLQADADEAENPDTFNVAAE